MKLIYIVICGLLFTIMRAFSHQSIQNWLEANNVYIIQCPGESLDSYIIELVWRMMARLIYAHGLQGASVKNKFKLQE